MAKLTLVFAVLLAILGVVSYVGTGSQHTTALIPLWFGLVLGLFGFLAISPNEKRRMMFMHINVTIGLVGFIGAAWRAIQSYGHARSLGIAPDRIALAAQATMAGLLLIYVLLCVKAFIDARRARLV